MQEDLGQWRGNMTQRDQEGNYNPKIAYILTEKIGEKKWESKWADGKEYILWASTLFLLKCTGYFSETDEIIVAAAFLHDLNLEWAHPFSFLGNTVLTKEEFSVNENLLEKQRNPNVFQEMHLWTGAFGDIYPTSACCKHFCPSQHFLVLTRMIQLQGHSGIHRWFIPGPKLVFFKNGAFMI